MESQLPISRKRGTCGPWGREADTTRGSEVIGWSLRDLWGHTEVERKGKILELCLALGLRASSPWVAKPRVVTSREEYETVIDKNPQRKNSQVPDGHP